MNAQGSPAPRAGHQGDVAVREVARGRIDPMQFDRRFRAMAGETRRFSGTGHGVPLVAYPAGVQQQRSFSRSGMDRSARRHRDKAGATIGMKEATFGEKASAARAVRGSRRPDERRQRLVVAIVEAAIRGDVEIARADVLESRKCRMLAEDIGDALPDEGLAADEPPRDLGAE